MSFGFNFGNTSKLSTSNLGGSTLGANGPSQSMFAPNLSSSNPAPTNTSAAQIDIQHLRPTTKFDQITPDLQRDVEFLDRAILAQIQQAGEVADLLPAVISVGETIPKSVEFVQQKLEECETGLENDAEAIVGVRDGDLKKSVNEAKCVFRSVDRLKVPRQYQVGHSQNESISGGVYGGSGLSGWWNHPQTLKGSTRGSGVQANTMQLPVDEADESFQGPKSLTELFNSRAVEMEELMKGNRELLHEIEGFMGGLEVKARGKEREFNERLNYGTKDGATLVDEKEHQMQLLRYVFGEVQRSLYDVADKVGSCRDGLVDLGIGR